MRAFLAMWIAACATPAVPAVEAPTTAPEQEPETRIGVSGAEHCDEVLINGNWVGPTPVAPRRARPGKHEVLCRKLGFEVKGTAEVEEGETVIVPPLTVVVVNALSKPWGRIVMENPLKPGQMIDLGIDSDVFVLPVPASEVTVRIDIKGPNGAIRETRQMTLRAGGRYVLRWSDTESSDAPEPRTER